MSELYQHKVLNQELSLQEYQARKTVLDSLPSKLLLDFADLDHTVVKRLISQEVLEKIEHELLPHVYFADLRELLHFLNCDRKQNFLDLVARVPLVNWFFYGLPWYYDLAAFQHLIQNGFIFVLVADSLKPERLNKIHGIKEGQMCIDQMAAIADYAYKTKRGCCILNCTLDESNMDEIFDIIRFAKEHNAHELQLKVRPSVFGGSQSQQVSLAATQVDSALGLALKLDLRLTLNDVGLAQGIDREKVMLAAKINPAPSTFNFPLTHESADFNQDFDHQHQWWPLDTRVIERSKVALYKKCFKPFHYVHVGTGGNIGICNHQHHAPLNFGNILEKPFAEIWNSAELQAFRNSLLMRQPQDERCKWCFEHRQSE